MKEFKFNTRTKFKVHWEGEGYVCTRPSNRELVELFKKIEKCKDDADKIMKLSKEFLHDCGLPPEVYDEMETEQIAELMEFINSKKK